MMNVLFIGIQAFSNDQNVPEKQKKKTLFPNLINRNRNSRASSVRLREIRRNPRKRNVREDEHFGSVSNSVD